MHQTTPNCTLNHPHCTFYLQSVVSNMSTFSHSHHYEFQIKVFLSYLILSYLILSYLILMQNRFNFLASQSAESSGLETWTICWRRSTNRSSIALWTIDISYIRFALRSDQYTKRSWAEALTLTLVSVADRSCRPRLTWHPLSTNCANQFVVSVDTIACRTGMASAVLSTVWTATSRWLGVKLIIRH